MRPKTDTHAPMKPNETEQNRPGDTASGMTSTRNVINIITASDK